MVRPLRRGSARRPGGGGDGHPRRPERSAPPDRQRPLHSGAPAPGRGRAGATARAARGSSSRSSTSSRSAGGRSPERTSRAISRSATTSGADWPHALGDPRWLDRGATPDAEVRARLAAAERPLVEAVLTARELEALDYGYRERVGDLHLPHIRDLPRRPAGPLRRGRLAGARGRLRRRRAPLCPRVHDGLVPLPAESPHGRLRRGASAAGAAAPRGAPDGPGPRRRRLRGRNPIPRPRRRAGRQRAGRRGLVRPPLRGGRRRLPVGVQGRALRGRPAAEGRGSGLPVHRRVGIRVHAHRHLGRARPVRPQRAAGGRDPRGPAGSRGTGSRSSRAGASRPSTRRRASSPAGRRTSSRPRARLSPTRTGSGRSVSATGTSSADASSRTTARVWISGTSR